MRIGSLFSGYGGLDLAVTQAVGGSVAWHVEFDKHPSAILVHHYPDVPNYGDVTSVDWAAVEPVDILTGGFPCQDLSHAGKRLGLKPGTRSGLWSHMAYAISQLRPSLVVIENVRGILSAWASGELEPCAWCVADESGEHVRALGAVLGDLASMGYDARWGGVRAADAGAPHGRFRVFVVAYPSGGSFPWSAPARHGLSESAERGDEPVTLFNTPTASDCFGAGRPPGRAGGDDLRTQISLLPTPTPFTNGNNETPEDWLERRADVIERTGTHHGLPLAVAAASISQGAPILQSDPMGSLLPTPTVQDGATDFGPYAAAVARWEALVGRPAPSPTEPGTNGQPRLSPVFVEWMMGLPRGWVTDVGISRNAALKCLGNGVVPQQAALALHMLLGEW